MYCFLHHILMTQIETMCQYQDVYKRQRITNVEANSMYAGIVIDTNNFMSRTGVRTFEAAALDVYKRQEQ